MLYEEQEVLLNANFHKYASLIITHISASLTDVAMWALLYTQKTFWLNFPQSVLWKMSVSKQHYKTVILSDIPEDGRKGIM